MEHEGATFSVIVGNIGTVYDGNSQTEAQRVYAAYVADSINGIGRAANEEVTLWVDGEIIAEHRIEHV